MICSQRDKVQKLFPPALWSSVFLVGGSLRDLLHKVVASDLDLAAALTDAQLISAGFHRVETVSSVPIYFQSHTQYGKIELVQLAHHTDLATDLKRRDFTVNAMAMGVNQELLDPLGGAADCVARILRPCSDTIFTDDPLRIFRAFRFAADGWRLSPELLALISHCDWDVALRTLPMERFSAELLKACSAAYPERFFQLMIAHNVGKNLLPELFAMPTIPAGPLQHHPEGDLLSHSVETLQRLARHSTDQCARFCAFFHDIGKLATDTALYPKHHGHDEAGVPLADALCRRLRLPGAYSMALQGVSRLHGKMNLWRELRDATKLRIAAQADKAGIAEMLPLVAQADKEGGEAPPGWQTVVAIARKNCAGLGIDEQWLETLPVSQRSDQLLQRRVALLRQELSSYASQ